MHAKVQNIIDKLMEHGEQCELTPAMEIIRLYKYNIVPSKMGGLWDSAFTVMTFAEGDLRQLSAYMLFSQIRMCGNEKFTLDHMKAIFLDSVPLSANFLATCGFEQLWDDVQEVMGILDLIETKEEYREMLDALCFYVTNLHNWAHFYFPWYLGDMFKQCKPAQIKEAKELLDAAGMTE